MPAYGGYFAPLQLYLPDGTLPSVAFYRSGVVLMLLSDLVLDRSDLDWSVHLPLILHCVLLGMDHGRTVVHEQCKRLLLNLLVALSHHSEFFRLSALSLVAACGSGSGSEQQFVLTVDGGPCAVLPRTESLADELQTNSASAPALQPGHSVLSLASVATLTPETSVTSASSTTQQSSGTASAKQPQVYLFSM